MKRLLIITSLVCASLSLASSLYIGDDSFLSRIRTEQL